MARVKPITAPKTASEMPMALAEKFGRRLRIKMARAVITNAKITASQGTVFKNASDVTNSNPIVAALIAGAIVATRPFLIRKNVRTNKTVGTERASMTVANEIAVIKFQLASVANAAG